MNKHDQSLRRWLESGLDNKRMNPNQLHKLTGLAVTTFTRILKGETVSTRWSTIEKIMEVLDLPPPPAMQGKARPVDAPALLHGPGFAEDEARQLDMTRQQDMPDTHSIFVIKSDALSMAGVLNGDHIVVDLGAQPRPGDIVCAQLYSDDGLKVRTLFRIYEPPYLVAASDNPRFRKPITTDRVTVMGVAIALQRSLDSVA